MVGLLESLFFLKSFRKILQRGPDRYRRDRHILPAFRRTHLKKLPTLSWSLVTIIRSFYQASWAKTLEEAFIV